jgi:NAD(P)H-hydrate epimerase
MNAGDILWDDRLPTLPARPLDSHKGTYGRVCIVAGSRGMSGAAILAGTAALRGGAGLVYVASPASTASIVASYEPSYLTIPLPEDLDGRATSASAEILERMTFDVMAFGPGLGQSESLRRLMLELLPTFAGPMIVDADGLNLLVDHLEILPRRLGPTLLTPHLGEWARLLGVDVDAARDDDGAAHRFASDHRAIVIRKGPGTLVTDGERAYRNRTGNPGMATGGTGDVLTGLLAALIGQGMSGYEAGKLAVHLHGRAGDQAATDRGEISLIASDLLDFLPRAIRDAVDDERIRAQEQSHRR